MKNECPWNDNSKINSNNLIIIYDNQRTKMAMELSWFML